METIRSAEREPLSFIRATTSPEDIAAFIALEKTAEHLHTYSAESTEEDAIDTLKECEVYFVKRGSEIVGSVSYKLEAPDSAYIDGLITKPESYHQGVGRAAMETILGELKDVPHVWLVTHPENENAIALYESLGFEKGEVKENYFDDGEPRVVMTLKRS